MPLSLSLSLSLSVCVYEVCVCVSTRFVVTTLFIAPQLQVNCRRQRHLLPAFFLLLLPLPLFFTCSARFKRSSGHSSMFFQVSFALITAISSQAKTFQSSSSRFIDKFKFFLPNYTISISLIVLTYYFWEKYLRTCM